MKRFICIALCVMMSAFVFCSCGQTADNSNGNSGQSSSAEKQTTLKKADFGWIKCDIPEGYKADENKYSKDPSVYKMNSDTRTAMNFFRKEIPEGDDMDDVIESTLEQPGAGVLQETFEMGSRTWYPIYEEDRELTRYYTFGDEGNCLYIAAFGLTKDDEAFKTVFGSIELDFSKYGQSDED